MPLNVLCFAEKKCCALQFTTMIMANKKITSLENSSILRKFTILFFLMSILPLGVLYYFYYQIKEQGSLDISETSLSATLMFMIAGIFLGFLAMRGVLKNLVDITRANKETLKEVLGPTKFQEITENSNEIAVLARSFNEIISRLEDNIKNLELSKKTLHSVLSRVTQGISSMENIDSFLELILETVAEALSAKVGVLMLLDAEENEFSIKAVYGVRSSPSQLSRLNAGDDPFRTVLTSKKPLLIPKFSGTEVAGKELEKLFEAPLLCAPLVLHEKVLGIISVSGKKNDQNFKDEELNLLFNLALQTAVAIENSQLNSDAEKTYLETVSALALAVEAKDQYSSGHLERVAEYVVKIAQELGLGEEEIKILRDGARLHDVGKIGIFDEILRKPDSLTADEWIMMKKHTEIGEGIVKPIRSLSKLCDIIRHHHEKLDGSGYPDGLKGDEISLLARILCVADIFDALTTDRPYRKAFSIEQAKEELIKMKGKLDPKVVDALLKIF